MNGIRPVKGYICFWIITVLMAQATSGFAGKEDSLKLKDPAHRLLLKGSPLSLADPLPAIQLGLEHRSPYGWSLQAEFGYIHQYFNPLVAALAPFDNLSGYRFRSEIRLYGSPPYEKIYWAGEFFYLDYNMDHYQSFGYNCFDQECSWYEWAKVHTLKKGMGLHAKLGFQEAFYQRFYIDIYGGLGFRRIEISSENEPAEGIKQIDRDIYFPYRLNNGLLIIPSMSFGFKFGWAIF